MIKTFFESFKYALNGIKFALQTERNMRVHLCVGAYVYFFSFFYNFSSTEYCILTILIFGVIAFEMINSSIERVVDNPLPEKFYIAGKVKDIAAGAVLIFSIGAAICGFILFWDVLIIKEIFDYFITHIFSSLCLMVSFILAFIFVFQKEKTRDK